MMGRQPNQQQKLFYDRINLDQRIRSDHVLRQIAQHIDFDFIYNEVQDTYGDNGNVSVPPPVILRMMLLLILYNVRSERELLSTLPERLDWLWFLGFDLDDEIPNHSVLSKARTRWGTEAFKQFFERIVWQCVEAGLVDGRKLFMDGCLIQANASNNSVVNTESLKRYLNKSYQKLEARLEEPGAVEDDSERSRPGPANRTHISTTDPDASVVRQGGSRSKLKYQVHRAVDERCEVITATEVTPGSVNEAHRMDSLLDAHEHNTARSAEVCVADSKYGTIENYLSCHDRGVKSHFASFEQAHRGSGRQQGIFAKEAFDYDPGTDSFRCPAGERLTRRRFNTKRQQWEYTASIKTCRACTLASQCTRSRLGRSLKRHLRQQALDTMLSQAESGLARRDRKTRQHLMERSFARGTRYGLKQARWRRLWRVEIQEYLTATIQNMMVLIRCLKDRLASAAKARARSIKMSGVKQSGRQQLPGQYAFNQLVCCALGLRWPSDCRGAVTCQSP